MNDRAEWLACVNHDHTAPSTVWVFYLNEDGNPVIENTDSPPEASVLLDVTLDQDGNFEAISARGDSNIRLTDTGLYPPSVSASPTNNYPALFDQLKGLLDRTTQPG